MRIPFAAIDTRPAEPGRELRIGLFRIAGAAPKKHYAWQPTGGETFHVPQAFGTLRLHYVSQRERELGNLDWVHNARSPWLDDTQL